MKYQVKEYEVEFNSKDFPKLNFQQFEAMVEQQTAVFVNEMIRRNTQFIALQDLTVLGVATKFYFVAGCAAIRRIYQFDAPSKNHFVRLEASALVEVAEVEQLLPGEKPLNTATDSAAVVAKAN